MSDEAGDSCTSIENLAGSNFADTLTGDGNANTLSGLSSNDTLIGGADRNSVEEGTGSDTAAHGTASAGEVANLAAPAGNDGHAAGDSYTSNESQARPSSADP